MRLSPETLTSSFQSSVPHSSVAVLQAPMSQRQTIQYYCDRQSELQAEWGMHKNKRSEDLFTRSKLGWVICSLSSRVFQPWRQTRRLKLNVVERDDYLLFTWAHRHVDIKIWKEYSSSGILVFVNSLHGRWRRLLRPASKSKSPLNASEPSFHLCRSFFGMPNMILKLFGW